MMFFFICNPMNKKSVYGMDVHVNGLASSYSF